MDWYFEKNGGRLGPFSIERVRQAYTSGEIQHHTLVWNNSFGTEWRPLIAAGVIDDKTAGPPPLPVKAINNSFAWIFALFPLIGLLFEKIIEDSVPSTESSYGRTLLIYGAAYTILGYIDERQIEKSGRNKNSVLLKWLFFIAPAYLFQRARALGERKTLFGVWVAAFIGSLVIDNPKILQGDVYLGVGIPACDAGISARKVLEIFDDVPLAKLRGLKAVSVKDQSEQSNDDKSRTCLATVLTTTGTEQRVKYEISKQGDNYYFQLNFE